MESAKSEHREVQPGSDEFIAEKLANLSPKSRARNLRAIDQFRQVWNTDYIVGLVNGTVKTSLIGEVVREFPAYNSYRISARDGEPRQDLWERWKQVFKHLPLLREVGLLPGLNDIHSDINFALAFHPNRGEAYLATHPEITLGELTVAAAFFMAAQVGKISYDAFEQIGETLIIEDGREFPRQVGREIHANSSGISHHSSGRYSAWQRSRLRDTSGTEVSRDFPGRISVPPHMALDWWDTITSLLGLNHHGAINDGQKVTLLTTQRGTNPHMRLEDVWHMPGTTENAAKTLVKRLMLGKERKIAEMIYGDSTGFQNPFETPVASWQFPHGTVQVAISESPKGVAEGWAGSTITRMRQLLRRMGYTRYEARTLIGDTEAFHDVFVAPFGAFKGNILIYDEDTWKEMSLKMGYPLEAHIVWDADSFSATPMGADHQNQLSVSLDPIPVDTEAPMFREANAEQMWPVLRHIIDEATLEKIPNLVIGNLEEGFLTGHRAHLDATQHEDHSDTSAAAPKERDGQKRNLFVEATNLSKHHYFQIGNGMYDSRRAMWKFAAQTFTKVQGLVTDLAAKEYCGALLPMGYCRIHAGYRSPVTPEPGSVFALRKKGADRPYVIFVDDSVMGSKTFKWRMEFVDGDDATYHITLIDEEGNFHVLLVKTPTSPHGAAVLPISADTAADLGTIPIPMKLDRIRILESELQELLEKSASQYVPMRMDDTASEFYRGKMIQVTASTTATSYAHEAALISRDVGSLGRFSDLVALAYRSSLWEDLPREEYLAKIFVQMSMAVDATFLRTSTITPMTNRLADAIIEEIHAGKGVDCYFLFQPRKEGLRKFLSDRYKRLLRAQALDGIKGTYLVDGLITPNHNTRHDTLWEKVGEIPKRLLAVLHRNSSLLHAVSNGPLQNYLTPVSAEAASAAEQAFLRIEEIRDKWGIDWNTRERDYLALAESNVSKINEMQPGDFSAAMAQCHATMDNQYSLSRMPLADTALQAVKKLELVIDYRLPSGIAMPVVEYLGREELKAFFNSASTPTVFMQVNTDNELVVGNNYEFEAVRNFVVIRDMDAETVDPNDPFTIVMEDEGDAAICQTQKGKEWAAAAQGVGMVFKGFVHWSTERAVNNKAVLPVAVFEPNMEQLIQWEVD